MRTSTLADLGRGGSDLTATVIGRALQSQRVVLYKAECVVDAHGFGSMLAHTTEQRKWLGIVNEDRQSIASMSRERAFALTANHTRPTG